MQLDLFNEYKLEEYNKKIQLYERIINQIVFNCNHYQNTKCNYTQQEIGKYLILLIEWELNNG